MDDVAGHPNQLGSETEALLAAGLTEAEAELVLEHRRAENLLASSAVVQPASIAEAVDYITDGPTVVAVRPMPDGESAQFNLTFDDPIAGVAEPDNVEVLAAGPAFGGRSKWLCLAVAVGLALISGMLVRLILRRLFEGTIGLNEETILADFFLVTLPFVIAYFAWMKRAPLKVILGLAAAVAALALAINLYPQIPGYHSAPNYMTGEAQSQTGGLSVLHLPVVLWLLAGLAYSARRRLRNITYASRNHVVPLAVQGKENSGAARFDSIYGLDEKNRHPSAPEVPLAAVAESPSGGVSSSLDFVRFTGEWAVFLVLTWLAGGTIVGLVLAALNLAGVEFWRWEMGLSVIVGMLVPLWLFLSLWLTELTRNVVSKVLSVLSWLFTPIMLIALVLIFTIFLSSGTLIRADRDLLILLDGVLVVVLALVLYSVASRNPNREPGIFDWLQLVMVAIAVVMNVFALIWMVVRLADFGWTANRAAALGLNLILVINLAYTAWLLFKFITSKRQNLLGSDIPGHSARNEVESQNLDSTLVATTGFTKILHWQTKFLPIYAIWAAAVILLFPLIFSVTW